MSIKYRKLKTTLLVALIGSTCTTLANVENLTKPPKGYAGVINRTNMVTRLNDQFPLSDQNNQGRWSIDKKFSDEFELEQLNTKRWHPNNPGWKGRKPTYFHGSNVSFDNGELVMKINQHGDETLPDGYTHSAAFIKSKSKILYGYFESEAKLMDAPWVSGFWLTNVSKDWWTEIDIAENCPCVESNRHDINSNVHVFRSPPEHGNVKKHFSSSKKYYHPDKVQNGYHVWGLEWNKDVIRFFIDGIMFREVENTHWHQPLEINLNNESNKWFQALPDDNRLDEEYRVKYVRVWREK